jgi:hypothetical protein
MRSEYTKSKNLRIYQCLLKYDKTIQIPIDSLAKEFRCHQNKIIALIGCAKRYETIYLALREIGVPDVLIPEWFRRPSHITYNDSAQQNAQRYTPENLPPYAETPSSHPKTLGTPTPKATDPMDNQVFNTGAQRRSPSLSRPAYKPRDPYEPFYRMFEKKIPININFQTIPTTPFDPEISELQSQFRTKQIEMLERLKERNRRQYIYLMKKILNRRLSD